ncbi:hypothetical protein N7537_009234 [Penicillium hordei]|uniref:LysM domain-containing protein n=1 Tax=Penicillium hordei TaxID=40994 RepID=A0AAD6DT52_9EURO|nr:uncharacterized protein N7537_009234 [Penicillium hordei]KAJ5592330.1 hypothetical protein N7537_009234 [Penicillium hordei]
MGSFQKGVFLVLCCLHLIYGTVALSEAEPEYNQIEDRSQYTYPYTCPSILIGTRDTCDDLASRCSISKASFTSFNPKNSGGYCYAYTIRDGDTCAKIAKGYKITETKIETWNTHTTAWYGCNKLQVGGQVCLSEGQPPMPVAIGDAVCGPQVPGTARPKLWTEIASLNPCPAGQCCSTKGKCGTGADFCAASAPAAAVLPASATKAATKAASKATSVKTTSTTKAISATSKTKDVPLSARSVVTMTAEAVTVTAKAKSAKKADSHTFTTDIPLVDVPLTFLHPEDTMSTSAAAPTNTATDSGDFLKAAQKISLLASRLRNTIGTTTTTTTKAKPATTTKKSIKTTTTKASSTKTVNGVVTVPSGWSLKMFDGIGCTGSYVLLQGHNKNLDDSDCMKFRSASKLKTDVTDTSVSCRWWTIPERGNWEWRDCKSDSLNKPKSWIMTNGLCTVSPNTQCDLVNDLSQTYGWRGPGLCHERQTVDPTFGSLKCYVG